MIALIGMPSGLEMLIVALVVLLLFGKRIPGLMRSLGQSVVEFKRGVNDPDQLETDTRDETTRGHE